MRKLASQCNHTHREARGFGLCGACYETQRLKKNPQQRAKASLTWRRCKLSTRYGITLEEYDALFSKQNGVCQICKRHLNADRHLAVDHNHDTGEIRGLLCDGCNMRLEWYMRNQEVIEDYLKEKVVTA